MKRYNDDYILLTNNEARELQRVLLAAADAVERLGQDREELEQICDSDLASKAAYKLEKRLKSWKKRIHRVWSSYGNYQE